MGAEDKAIFRQQYEARRERQNKQKADTSAAQNEQIGLSAPSRPAHPPIHEPPATGLEAMMGLDDMGELEIPEHHFGGAGVGGGMTEEQMIAMAIAESMKDMSLQEGA